jgi:hypothetical protein
MQWSKLTTVFFNGTPYPKLTLECAYSEIDM